MKKLLTLLTCLFLTGCTKPIGAYVVPRDKANSTYTRMSSIGEPVAMADPLTAGMTMSGPFFPNLKCAPGTYAIKGFHKSGHDVTLTGKGGEFEITADGWITNDVDNCLSDMGKYGYTLIEFVPPVSDVYFETFFMDSTNPPLMQCWLSYHQVGGTRGRYETGPGVFGYDSYMGTLTFGIGYNGTPVPGFTACYIYGEDKFRIGYIP